ncbi:hypothetical protein D3C72_1308190 [compost metagenome]
MRDTVTGAPKVAPSAFTFQAASLASPSVLASAAARSVMSCARILSFTSASGIGCAAVYCVTRPDASWFGPTSMASVFCLRSSESEAYSACRKLRLASGPVAPGAGVRGTLVAVWIVSFSFSAAGFRLSGC